MNPAVTFAAHAVLAALAVHLLWESTSAFVTYWKENTQVSNRPINPCAADRCPAIGHWPEGECCPSHSLETAPRPTANGMDSRP